MSDVNANIGIQIDSSLALAELKNLQRQLANFHSAVSKSSAAAAIAQKNLQNNLINSINETGKFRAQMGVIRTSTESFTNALEKNKFGMREYFRYAGGATKTFGRLFRSEFDTIQKVAVERVKDLQTQYIKMGRDANGAMRAIAIRPLALDMENYATKTQIAAQRQALFNQLLKQGSTNLLNFGKNTQWAGRQLMVGFSIPLAYLGTAAAKTFMAIEEQAIKFKRVYGDIFTTTTQTDEALENVRALAKEFTKYGVAVEKTLELAAKAAATGKVNADLMAQVTEATRLAILGQVEQEQALETTISLQNAFGQSADELAKDIDFLNAVENQTVVSIEDLTIAIPKAGPVVKQLGGDVKDLAYFLTAMKEGGINASEGANALKSGLASLINPTEKASAMLAEMGININDIVEKNKGNLRATVEEFATALDTLAPLERARAIEQLFGKFQFARLSTLFENVAKQGTQAARVLDLAGASVEELAILSERELKTVEDAIGTDFKEAVQQLRLALEPIGKMFLKTITPVAKTIAGFIEKFRGLDEGTQKVIIVITTLVGLIGPTLLMTFGLVANGVANLIKLFGAMRGGFLKLYGGSKSLAEQTQYMATEQAEAATVAAALNQSHNRLIQTFTTEAAAVAALRKAYIDATVAAGRFAAANPGMMSPTRGGRGPKKYAKGVTAVPGTGNQDTVPALLTPGEGVVPADIMKNPEAQVLLQALIEGNLFKYNQGVALAGEEYSHVGKSRPISIDEILKSDMSKADRTRLTTYRDMLRGMGLETLATTRHSLAYSFPGELNRKMASAGITFQEFENAWNTHGSKKWISSGLSATEAQSFDKAMLEQIRDKVKNNPAARIDDTLVEKAFKDLPASVKKTEVYDKLMKKYTTFGDYTIGKGLGTTPRTTEQMLKKAMSSGSIPQKPIVYIDGDAIDPATNTKLSKLILSKKYPLPEDSHVIVTRKNGTSNSGVYVTNRSGELVALGRGGDGQRYYLTEPKSKGAKGKETVAVQTGEKKVSKTGKETRLGIGTTTRKPASVKTTSGSLKDNRTAQLDKGDKVMSRKEAERRRRYKIRGLVEGDLSPAQRLAASEGISLNKAKKLVAEQEKYAKALAAATKEQLNMKDRVRQLSGRVTVGAGAVSGLAIAASFAGGKIGEMAQTVMPFAFAIQGISAILPMLMNPWGLAIAAVVGLTAMIWKMNKDLDKAREAGIQLGKAMTMSADDVKQLGTITGRVGASEEADRRRKNLLSTGVTEPQRQAGQVILESEYGKGLLSNIETMSKTMQPKDVASNVADQLGQAILQGVINMDEAAGIASALGEKLGSYDIPLNITGKLNQIFGPNGENLKDNPLEVALAVKKESMKTQADAFKASLAAKQSLKGKEGNATGLGVAGLATTAVGLATANPFAIAAGIGMTLKASADLNKLSEQKLKLDSASVQLGVEAVAQGQDLIDSINKQYDGKVKEAKTQKEINDLEIKRRNAIDQLNKKNNETLQTLVDQKDQLEPGAFDAAIKASVDSLYKEGPMSVFKDQALEALKGIQDSDFKAQMQLGFASGDIDPLTLTNILNMAAGSESIQKNIQFLVSTEGFANTGLMSSLLNTASQGDQTTFDVLLNYVNKNDKTFNEDMEAIKRITDFKSAYNITLDMKTNGVAKIKAADTALTQIKDLPPKITKEALMKANTDGQFDDIVSNWETLSQGKDQIDKNLIVNYKVGVIDQNLINAAAASNQSVAEYIAKGFVAPTVTPPPPPPPPSTPKERDTSLDDLLKRLRTVRDASIDVTKGIGLIKDKFKKTGGEGWKAFKGMENALLNMTSVGKNREFINYLSGLDKKAYATYVNMDKLKKGVFELTAKGNALNMAFNDVKIGEYVVAQQEAAKSTNAQKIAFANLVKNGMDASLAMEVVADAEMAVAINSKAASGEIKKTIKELQNADEIIKRNALISLLDKKDIDISKKLKLASIVPQMKQLGMSSDQIREALDNPTIADGLLASLKNGQIEASTLNRLIDQAVRDRQATLTFNIKTNGSIPTASDALSQIQSGFNELYNLASTVVDLKYAPKIKAVEAAYDKAVETADAALTAAGANEGGALDQAIAKQESIIKGIEEDIAKEEQKLNVINKSIDAKQKEIDAEREKLDVIDAVIEGYQKQIDAIQRRIEIEFNRPVEALQEAIHELERQIEINFDRPMEVLQEESSDLSNDLTLIDKAAEAINKKYDAQVKALEDVKKINDQILNQQKGQLSLADALSEGDVSRAAQIMQEMRSSNAAAAAGSISDALQAAREGEIAGLRSASGMTRDQIEQRQFQISQQIYALEEQRETKQLEIRNIQDQIYQIEKNREVLQKQIRDLEDQIYQQNLLKEPIIAKIAGYEKDMANLRVQQQEQEEAIQKIKEGRLKAAENELKAQEALKAAAEKAHQEAMKQAEAKKQADLKAIEEKKKKEMEALDALKAKIDLQAAALALAAFQAAKLPELMKEAKKWGLDFANALNSIFGGVDLNIPDEFKTPDGSLLGANESGVVDTNTGLDQYGLNPNDPDYMEKFRARANLSGSGTSTGITGTSSSTSVTGGSKIGLLTGMLELQKQQKAMLTMIRDIDIEITKQKIKQFENTKETWKLLDLIKLLDKERNLTLEFMKQYEKDLYDLYILQHPEVVKLKDEHILISDEMKKQRDFVGEMLDAKNKQYGLAFLWNWWNEIKKLLSFILTDIMIKMKETIIIILETTQKIYNKLEEMKAPFETVNEIAKQFAASIASAASNAASAYFYLTNMPAKVYSEVYITEYRTVYETVIQTIQQTVVPDPNAQQQPPATVTANKGGLIRMASGGTVPGPSINKDVIPAMLTPGEFVINREATSKFLPLLSAINGGKIPSFNKGGILKMNSGGFVSPRSSMPRTLNSSIGSRIRSAYSPSFGNNIRSAAPRFPNFGMSSMSNVSIPSQAGKSENNNQVVAPVYNYNMNFAINNPGADANQIANVVISKIQAADSQQIRGGSTYIA